MNKKPYTKELVKTIAGTHELKVEAVVSEDAWNVIQARTFRHHEHSVPGSWAVHLNDIPGIEGHVYIDDVVIEADDVAVYADDLGRLTLHVGVSGLRKFLLNSSMNEIDEHFKKQAYIAPEDRVYVCTFNEDDVSYRSDYTSIPSDDDGNILELTVKFTGYQALLRACNVAKGMSNDTAVTTEGTACHLGIYPPGVEMEALGETVQDITVNVLGNGSLFLDVLRDEGGRYEVHVPFDTIKQFFSDEGGEE